MQGCKHKRKALSLLDEESTKAIVPSKALKSSNCVEFVTVELCCKDMMSFSFFF
ncbi:hypothetical protein IMY05_017G0024700 [Salix suchowensis]|nr:hypothetical protein IMY05_017G0024700 [Salix suchowensis]